ncbi:hypothetical protein PCCS19_33510 [Paenibacillus sp. CCS19]|uniref:hypothetical protein n=1 Tax=Paenibacillus sp. CCS19 TaxID=3158387 RepID=UPI00256BF797|nr:hypothetical protein [Paenibacillus cellulosilyticus]GMK40295.1 hypothetical protein PCCS19_33510 [Paenibacillus cellulosilyticus]
MSKRGDRLTVIVEKRGKRIITRTPLHGIDRLVFVVNHQFTNAPNTTQLASGAGRSSAAGSNAAIKSPHTQQQQSVGAGGTAKNVWLPNKHAHLYHGHGHGRGHHGKHRHHAHRKEVIIVLNDQVVKLPKHAANASATQVASGAGKYSTSGTNSAIESAGTRQQQAVGGGGKAINKHGKGHRVWKPWHKHTQGWYGK